MAFLKFAHQQLDGVRTVVNAGPARTAVLNFLTECLPQSADQAWTLWFDVWDEAMHDAALAEVYREVNKQWHEILTLQIRRGVASGEFKCEDSERAARQIFSLTMGYADELLLEPSKEAADSAVKEVFEVAELLLGVEKIGTASGKDQPIKPQR